MLNNKKLLIKILDLIGIEYGSETYSSIPVGSYGDVQITFGHTFKNFPTVIAMRSSAGSVGYNIQLATSNISKSSCTIRCWNNGSGTITPSINWIAFGGGYSLKALFHRLAERWWEYAERKETTHQNASFHNKGRYCQRDTIGKQLLKLEQNDNKSRVSSDWGNWLRPPEHLCVCFTCRAYICLDWFRNNILHDKKHIGRFFKLPFVCRRSLAAGIGTDISERGWSCA